MSGLDQHLHAHCGSGLQIAVPTTHDTRDHELLSCMPIVVMGCMETQFMASTNRDMVKVPCGPIMEMGH